MQTQSSSVTKLPDGKIEDAENIQSGIPGGPDLSKPFDVAIDALGNVWLTNNWLRGIPPLENPGGHEVVAFIGLAAPVKGPLIGPPQKP